jgi:hypothetical protein
MVGESDDYSFDILYISKAKISISSSEHAMRYVIYTWAVSADV